MYVSFLKKKKKKLYLSSYLAALGLGFSMETVLVCGI